ncbi:MAG: hypothetical protein ACHQCH_10505, partial [Solirubrobacterales bacterium]
MPPFGSTGGAGGAGTSPVVVGARTVARGGPRTWVTRGRGLSPARPRHFFTGGGGAVGLPAPRPSGR